MVEFIGTLYALIERGISLYQVLLIIYILMSWVPSMRENAFGRFLEKIVEPYLGFFRKFIPPLGMIDISPIVAIFALRFISSGVGTLFNMIIRALL